MLPRALDRLAAGAAEGGALAPLWAQVCGGPIARVSRPTRLADGVLEVDVETELWAAELRAREKELLERLATVLAGQVRRLRFRVAKR